eukprot:CAMPEP_0197563950 /NCGR_PEP_ID=MMETSP1320-20131121/29599_1 /TAXON_ID=91990 /ORGANISM="Bolidomonas sp., Strain RCC2347" /LENGTH=57 /DNA_ID=CAMNT_0043125825 /DNA_START=11 /DNA_END=180 /DNA_ORIENTATION=-
MFPCPDGAKTWIYDQSPGNVDVISGLILRDGTVYEGEASLIMEALGRFGGAFLDIGA